MNNPSPHAALIGVRAADDVAAGCNVAPVVRRVEGREIAERFTTAFLTVRLELEDLREDEEEALRKIIAESSWPLCAPSRTMSPIIVPAENVTPNVSMTERSERATVFVCFIAIV
jgi:hypothetical protein